MLSVFFFQAEDGIRDLTVTGVQTCALPISQGVHPARAQRESWHRGRAAAWPDRGHRSAAARPGRRRRTHRRDRKSTRLNSSHSQISYAVFCLKKKNKMNKSISMLT